MFDAAKSATMPRVMRVVTEVGEASLIIAGDVVEHASPAACWALWMPLQTLKRRIAAGAYVACWAKPHKIHYIPIAVRTNE